MRRLIYLLGAIALVTLSVKTVYPEGTKQLMPNSSDRLWLEFNVFQTGSNDFAGYDCAAEKKLFIRLRSGEKVFFGFKMNTVNYGGNVNTDPTRVRFRIRKPDGTIAYVETAMPTSGNGYITNYTQAITGPNGTKLNGVNITTGYSPLSFTADQTGDYYIEFKHLDNRRWALEFFDITVTDASNNIITNPGEPNKPAGRIYSKGWQMTTTSYTEYPVNNFFYVFTSDEFVNKINFQYYPFSFKFQSNSYGIIPSTTEPNYIKRAQSKDNDQTANAMEYRVYLNDPDRSIWPTTRLAPPKIQVWAEDTLFYDYDYMRTPMQLPVSDYDVYLEKNRVGCPYSSVAIFKMEMNIDAFVAILIDIDGNGYSTSGSDRVIYRDLKKGINYILWDFKNDAGAEVPVGVYNASATFMGRGPTNFPVYDVEQCDGVTTSSVRPFRKLNATIYWDDTFISRWGDETGQGLMDATQRTQLVQGATVPRIWSWNAALQNTNFNGNMNTMNTWFNAIDLGYSNIKIHVTQSATKCINGLAPWVGNIYKEGPLNTNITFTQADFTSKFFDPTGVALKEIRITSLPSNGTLRVGATPISTVPYTVTAANLANLNFVPTTNWWGRTSFTYEGRNNNNLYSNNTEQVYLTVNTPPTITPPSDQSVCTNSSPSQLNFTVSDGSQTPAANIVVTAYSHDPNFVLNGNIEVGGTGTNRWVKVTPVANKSGHAIIYLMADDGYSQTIQEFAVYVGPDLEFSGDTTVCVGQDLYLVAQEQGATSYTWKYGSTTISTSQTLSRTWGNFSPGAWSLTVVKDGCTSTRNFTVDISPNTSFTGDVNVCVGEAIDLTAVENNATYEWKKGSTVVSTTKQFYKASAVLADAGTNYTLKVTKAGCTYTSAPFTISVVNPPSTGLTVTGSTVDPGHDGTITVNSTQSGITYNVYKNDVYVASGVGTGGNLVITIPAANLQVGNNLFVVKANNGNCEIPLSSSATIVVREPGFTISAISGNTTEAGGTATFTVVLKTQPTANVTLPISSSDLTEGTVSTASLTFTPANWNVAQTVTITGVDDYIVDGNITYTINIGPATSSDTYYNGIDPADINLLNIDNDVAGVNVSPTSGLITTEAGGTATFTMRLTAQPAANVTITLSSSNLAEGTVSPTSVTFTPVNWNTNQTVTVTGVDDQIDDGDVVYTIVTSNTSSTDPVFNNIVVPDVTVTNTNNDVAGILVNPTSGLQTTEAGGQATFTIRLNSQPLNNVTISLSSSNTAEGTVSPASVTFTPANWSTPQTITITGVDDDIDDGNISYTIITAPAVSTDPKYNNLNPADVSVVNINNDTAGITVTPTSGLQTTEAGGTATFTVRLTSRPTSNVTINLTSTKPAEGTVSPTSLTFTTANWNTVQTVTLTGQNDWVDDGDQAYSVNGTASSTDSKYNGRTFSVSATNLDDDDAGITVNPTSGLVTTEAGGTATFTIVLTSQPSANVTIGLSSSNTAEGTVSPASLTFTSGNWNIPQVVTVTGVDDAVADGPQAYTIITAAATSTDPLYNGINPTDVSVTNMDNDVAGVSVSPTSLTTNESGSPVTFTIVLNTKPTANVTINISSNDLTEGTVSPASVIFTTTDWNTPKTITVTPVNDDEDDGNITYLIVTSNASSSDPVYNNLNVPDVTVTNVNDDVAGITVNPTSGLTTTEAGGTATFTIRLNSRPTANVTIGVSSSNTAEGTVNPASVTFTPSNWNTNQTITITGVDDDVDDDDVAYTIVTAAATSTDTKYNGINPSDVSVTNLDNDVAGFTITPTSGLTTTEAGGTAQFTIRLNTRPTANVTITLNSSNPAEGTVSPTSLTFTPANWNTPQTVTITGVDDDVDDDNVAYTIITNPASSTDSKYSGLNPVDVSVTNTDNDTAGFTVSPTSGLTTTEAGGTAQFTIRLNTRPTANVTIPISSSNTSEGTVSVSSVTFTPANWNVPQTIVITGVDDDIDDDNVAYTIVTGAASSTDTKYNGLNPADVSVTNTDNDTAGITVNPTSGLTTTEAGGTATFTIRLNSRPTANVTIGLSSSNTAEGIVSPTSVTITPANWNNPVTVTVTGVDDFVDDGNIVYTILTAAATSTDTKYNGINPADVSVTNINDDVAGVTVNPTSGLTTTEAGAQATFSIRLNSRPTANVSIALNSSNTNEGTISPTSITFTPSNWNTPQTITITGVDDDVDDDDIAYTIETQPCVSTDIKYDNLNPVDVSVTNRDNDVAGYIVSPTSVSYSESGSPATVNFRLATKPTANVTFTITSENTNKGTVSPASLTFTPANWNVDQVLTITPVNNSIDDGDVTFSVTTAGATSTDSKYNNLNPPDIQVTCIDDDVAGITVSAISGNTREDGTTATFTIVLNTEPTADVTINVESSNTAEGTVSPASVTFTSANWNTPQTITVTGVDDAVADGNQTYTIIIHSAVSADPNYNGIDPDDITLQNIDNDQAGVNVFPVSGLITTEAGGTATFQMLLNSAPAADVTINFVSSNTNEGTVSPASHVFNVGNWNTPVTVTLTGVDDDVNDGDQSYQINISTSSADANYNNLTIPPVTASNLDDVTPRPVDDNATTNEVTSLNIDVLTNDKGLDKGVSSVTIATQPDSDKGSVSVNPDNTIKFTPVKTYNGLVTFSYRVTLNNDNWAEANVTVNVTKVNDIPVAVDDSRGASLNTPRVVDVLINDTGLEDGGIVVTIEEQPDPGKGNAVANVDNTVTFTPASGYTGLATFKYKVCDVDNDCSIATVTINVRPVNHVPVANDDAASTAVNTSKAINVLANDSGLDDGFGSITIYTQPANGNVVVNANRTVTYTPNNGFIGTDQFVYMLQDVDGDYDLATVTVNVTAKPNAVPLANPDKRATSKNTAVKVDVLTNDTGLDDGVASLTVIADPSNGTWQVSATKDSIKYTPNNGYVGTDEFQYQVCDVDGECSVASVTITVKDGINHVPVANKDSVTTIINKPVNINVLANDSGLDDGFGTITIHQVPEFGSVQVNANRTITYTPTYMFVGVETFYYMITDADGDLAIGQVKVNVIDRPDYIPVANDDRRGCSFNTPVVVDVLFNDTGLDDTPLTVTISQAPTQGIAIVNADNTVTFTPANGFIGQMTFRYTVTDSDGDSDDALVTITVKSGTNIVPVAVDDAATTKVNTPVFINVLANDRGLDDGFGNLYIYRQPEFGTVVVNANRTVTYTPTYMFVGTETFQYVVEDVDGDYSLATVTVTVLDKQNAIPVANDDFRGCSFNQSVVVDVLFNDTGLDDIPITVTISQPPAVGNVVVNADNTVTYTPATGFVGQSTFRYMVTDINGESDDALVTITVKAGVNNLPVAQNDVANTIINTPVDINVLANDTGLDDGFGNLTIRTQPMFGTVAINANRTITYYPSYMFLGTDTFEYLVEDVDGDYSVATVTVNVTEKPDAQPVANDDRRGCSFNTPVVVDVLFNDTGLDDTPLTVSISQAPAQGTAIVNANNTVTFTPAAGFVGQMTFRYTVTDADGDSDDALVTITVKSGTNVVPVAVNDAATTTINKPVTISVLANDSGLDDGFGSLYIYSQPQFGNVVVNANRTVTYTPSYMFVGTETFRYVVEDVDGDYAMATVTVIVVERPDSQPVANDDRRGCSFNKPVVVDVLFNDTGLDDAPLAVAISEAPVKGTATVNPDNTVTFTPEAGFIGTMTFRYTVTDADGDSDDALVTIRVKEGENIVPLAVNDDVTTAMNTSIDINVLANDSGLDDGFGDLRIHVQPQFGTVVVNSNRTITYTPSYMFIGTDTFQYLIEDVDGDYSVATVTVNVVERINHIPVANNDYRGTSYNTPRNVDVLFNDTGIEDVPLTITIISSPSNGIATVNSDNTIYYEPNNGYLGTDKLTYRVTDADGESDEADVYINVKPFNMIPEAHDDYVTTLVNTPVDVDVLANDTLLYEGIKSVQVHTQPKWGTVVVNADNTITYTPGYFFIGNDEFEYFVEDVDGDYSLAKVYITVLDRQNTIPVANDDRRATSKNTPVTIDVLINDDGLDDGWISVHIDQQPDPLKGSIVLNADNTVTFTPATDYLGYAEFKYYITDRESDTSNVATATVNVKEVNYVPVAVNDTATTTMNIPVLVDVIKNDTGLDDGVSYIKIMSKPRHGFAYVFDSRNVRYIPSSWFVGKDSLSYMVVDEDGDYGIAKIYIEVGERPDHKPNAMPDGRGTVKNTAVNVDILFNDTGLEDGGIKLLLTQMPTHGSVVLDPDNTVTYTPATDYLGEDYFRYQVCDFDNDCSTTTVTIRVKNTNLIPLALNDTVTTYKNRWVEFDPTFNDLNKSDGGIIAVVYRKPVNGNTQPVPASNTKIRYTPNTDFFGIDSLWYYIQDVEGDYTLAKVVINVLNRENYTPDARDDEAETYMNTTILIDVLQNDLYLNDGIKSVEVLLPVASANVVVTADYKLQYTPLNGYKGTEVFQYRVCDIDDECDIANVTITVSIDPNRKVIIPEAFSPNGDNINDTFEVQNIEAFQHVTLHVYNRWGNLVYKSENYKNDWDGTSNVSMAIGSKLPDGTYYYLLEIKDTGKLYKGSVFIKRSY
jgi:gliding motility-associated-like protein